MFSKLCMVEEIQYSFEIFLLIIALNYLSKKYSFIFNGENDFFGDP